MPFTLGDLILMELAIVRDMKDLDLSMQVGQQYIQLIGRIELAIQQLSTAQQNGTPRPLAPIAEQGGD